MTATNHVITGVLIVSVVSSPWIGLPLAFLSHVLLDVLPHYGINPERLKIFVPALLIDMTLAASIILCLLIVQPANFWLLIAGGIVSASLDLWSIPFFVSLLKHREHKFGLIQRFLRKVQWSESIAGLAIELVWFTVMASLLFMRLS